MGLTLSQFDELMFQWGLTLTSKETRTWKCLWDVGMEFQWGLTLTSKETCSKEVTVSNTEVVSMGPHSYEQGNVSESHGVVRWGLFQWGLTLTSKETPDGGARYTEGGTVSMGPHSYEQGNFITKLRSRRTYLFQWGLTLTSKETRQDFSLASLILLFQWGLTLTSKETASSPRKTTMSALILSFSHNSIAPPSSSNSNIQ